MKYVLALSTFIGLLVSCQKAILQKDASIKRSLLVFISNISDNATYNLDAEVYAQNKDFLDYEGDYAYMLSMRNDRPLGSEYDVRFTLSKFQNIAVTGNNFDIGFNTGKYFQSFGMQSHTDDATDYFAKVNHDLAAGKNITLKVNSSPIGAFEISNYLPQKLIMSKPNAMNVDANTIPTINRVEGYNLMWNADPQNTKGVLIELIWSNVNNEQNNDPTKNRQVAHYILAKDIGEYYLGNKDLPNLPNGYISIKVMRGNAVLQYLQNLKEPIATLFYDGVRFSVLLQ